MYVLCTIIAGLLLLKFGLMLLGIISLTIIGFSVAVLITLDYSHFGAIKTTTILFKKTETQFEQLDHILKWFDKIKKKGPADLTKYEITP